MNDKPPAPFGREVASCDSCGSSVRTRALVRMLALEIFGTGMALSDFPVLKSVRGIGMSDPEAFAGRLAAKFDYRNTHYDREPRLDILDPAPGDIGAYDFIVSSEVLEHVAAPVERAFENLFRMLKPNGLLLMTVPYRPEGDLEERFGPMSSFALAEIDGRTVMIRRSPNGGYEVLDNLVFHGGSGATLEMRVFSDASIRRCLAGAGFEVHVHTDDDPEFGVIHDETWSLPIAARKGQFAFGPETRREWSEQWLGGGSRARELEQHADRAGRLQADLEHERGVVENLREKLNRRNADNEALVRDFDRRIAALKAEVAHRQQLFEDAEAARQVVIAELAARERWIEALHSEVAHHKRLFEDAEAARRQELSAANAAIERLTQEMQAAQQSAQAAINRLELELASRTDWVGALQQESAAHIGELAAARERIAALEAMLRRSLFARVRRRFGLGNG